MFNWKWAHPQHADINKDQPRNTPDAGRSMPSWLGVAPWVAVACSLLLAAVVVLFELSNVRRESATAEKVMQEKGHSLINAFESALQTGAGFHWNDEELSFLVQRTAAPEDVRMLALVDSKGMAILAHPPELALRPLLPPLDKVKGPPPHGPTQTENGLVYRIYKEIKPQTPGYRKGHGHGGSGMWRGAPQGPWRVVVDYDLSAWDAARKAERTHMAVIGSILVFLAALGALTCYFLYAYKRSRRLARQSSAFAAEILRTLPVGVVALNAQGCITAINAQALRIADLSFAEAQGKDFSQAFAPVWEALEEHLAPEQTLQDKEMRCTFAQGRSVPLALSASPLTGGEGEYVGHVLILRDLGEIRHLQAELRRRDRLAALGTLAAGIAHEVRNPLSAIKGFARYFEECHPAGSQDAEIAATLGQEVLRLDKVVGDLLDFARPDSVQRNVLPLADLVERARRMVAPALEAQKVVFTFYEPPTELAVLVDGDGISQVLINLFLNAAEALRHSPSESRQLDIHASEQGTDLVLTICDNGPGISEEHLQDIFSPYFTTKAKGTGLGLSIVHKIVEAHGGSIEVANRREGGCVFTLRLPGALSGSQEHA